MLWPRVPGQRVSLLQCSCSIICSICSCSIICSSSTRPPALHTVFPVLLRKPALLSERSSPCPACRYPPLKCSRSFQTHCDEGTRVLQEQFPCHAILCETLQNIQWFLCVHDRDAGSSLQCLPLSLQQISVPIRPWKPAECVSGWKEALRWSSQTPGGSSSPTAATDHPMLNRPFGICHTSQGTPRTDPGRAAAEL